ncbi:MAG: SLC13 family permease [Gammaproteobacteria bacterium]|nr:SLC13 family permease [Gammaproteobacteria bacterium]
MSWEAWFTLAVIALCIGTLVMTRWAVDVVLMGGLTLLLVAGVLSPQQALEGLANEGMVTVGVLFIVSAAMRETGAIQWIAHYLFGQPKSISGAQLRMMAPVAALSAFLNNTPLVAMMIPAVTDWAKKHQVPVSKLLMPLSYAAVVGGTITLIGTSTNLVVNGLVKKHAGDGAGFGLFDLAWLGIPCTVLALIYILIAGRWLLPNRQSPISQLADARQYTVEMMVEAGSQLVGKTIEAAGLRQLPGMYLIEIERGEHILPAVAPQTILNANDRLVFAGVVDSIIDLQKIRGLKPATDQVFKLDAPRKERCLIEAVVSDSCPLVGKTIREGRFRTQYNAAIIAVARNGEQIKRKIGDIVLQAGDTLLLEGSPTFAERYRNSRDFFLVSCLEDSTPPQHQRAPLALGILVAMVLAVGFDLLSMLQAAMLAAGAMIMTQCLSGNTARRSVDWQVLIVIAASFALGEALQNSGAATRLGELVLQIADQPWLALVLIYFSTILITELITNNAAAVLMFPIAISVADKLHVNFIPFAVAVMFAASLGFSTPIGYQTNLMVYGPGGYRFSDFLRMGIPLTILLGAVAVFMIPMIWPF